MASALPQRTPAGRWRDAVAGAGPLNIGRLLAAPARGLRPASRALDPAPDRHLVIATGPEQADCIESAKRCGPLLKARGVGVELRKTQGSGENLALLRDPRCGGHADFVPGGADGDTARRGIAGQSALRAARLHPEGARAQAGPRRSAAPKPRRRR